MSTQILEPKVENSTVYMNVLEGQPSVLIQLGNLLNAESNLKHHVNHDSSTVKSAVNTLLGAMITDGSEDLMKQIYKTFESVILFQIQQEANKRGWSISHQYDLKMICDDLTELYPFAHRTTVQEMLNDHTKENSDHLLGENFQKAMDELDAVGYKPSKVAIIEDPHFDDFKPAFKNNEVRKILIGGQTTVRTGYQLNLTNVSPIGLYSAIALAPKRQKNSEDLGDLQYAVLYGKAIERVDKMDIEPVHLLADRGLEILGMFKISQEHAWPQESGEIGTLRECTKDTFFVTPWSSSRMTKADIIKGEKLEEVFVISSEMPTNQYKGHQPLVQHVLGENPGCKVSIETAILVLQKHKDKYCRFQHQEVQDQLQILTDEVNEQEKALESLKTKYFNLSWSTNPEYKERGITMKLNSKSKELLSNESTDAWVVRKAYCLAGRRLDTAVQKRDAFLREFQIFQIGVDEEALGLLKGDVCKRRNELVELLKSCGKDYCSRWCIESGFEIIKYQFPLHFYGNSSDTHLRCFVIQAMIFNYYRVAQIKHIGATKPHNWRPWDPKNKLCCRQFCPADRRSFSTKGYILDLLKQSLNSYFCRVLS